MSSILIILCSLFALITAQSPSSYPPCAAQCLAFRFTNGTCGPADRAQTAACEKISCSATDYEAAETLNEQACSPLYTNNTIDPTPISSAIASATAAAIATVAGQDLSVPDSEPACAVACVNRFFPGDSGCGTFANSSCVCNSPVVLNEVGDCQETECGPEDLITTVYFAFAKCAPVGGVANVNAIAAANQTGGANQTAGTVASPPPPPPGVVPFTGGAGSMVIEKGLWFLLLGGLAVTWTML
ncbi:MAG: hypothetical protein Q9169_006145 [Polycauliona sp. 2 TL-2023]